MELGVCERGKSNWSSPLLMTTKPCSSPCTCSQQYPCGGWRVCGDYRRLNNMTMTDRYPVRNLQDFNNELRGKKFFSKVDLLKGYHQIPVNDQDVKKMAVITPFGLFLFPRCPFGLKNAGQDFQRLMGEILGTSLTYLCISTINLWPQKPWKNTSTTSEQSFKSSKKTA